MEFLKSLILGLIQGLCEFLPISSSGHLFLAEKLLGIEGNLLLLNIVLHIATLLAIVFAFYREIWKMVKVPFSNFNLKLVVSIIPTVIIALVLAKLFDEGYTGRFIAFGFLITAVLLLVDKIIEPKLQNSEITYKTAIFMGIVQGFATLPGISRSGSTVAGGALLTSDREKVAKFSFFMSILAIIASTVYELAFNSGTIGNFSATFYITAFLAAFISGFFALKLMIKVVVGKKYGFFIIYLIAISTFSFFVFSFFVM
ncbi:MAG: undecaprenyl-diphosphate phosphatase [Firmicutes bacterium]|nr:undecaprenyl-diphosphate phosphatase [Bacillota bacterium]